MVKTPLIVAKRLPLQNLVTNWKSDFQNALNYYIVANFCEIE